MLLCSDYGDVSCDLESPAVGREESVCEQEERVRHADVDVRGMRT